MTSYLLTFFIFIISLSPSNAQVKDYKLISKITNANFNYKAINLIDTTSTRESTRNIFNPIKGKYTVYTFIATFKGLSFDDTEKEFHDILIIKTDNGQKIIDAYQYTLEWAEMPLSYDLYKASPVNAILKPLLSINKLKLYKVGDSEKEYFNEQGVIIF